MKAGLVIVVVIGEVVLSGRCAAELPEGFGLQLVEMASNPETAGLGLK
jgi:hypothetical protein